MTRRDRPPAGSRLPSGLAALEYRLRVEAYALRGWGPWVLSEDELRRPIFVTPYPGAYGVAGWVVTIEGTPPRGAFVVDVGGRGLAAATVHIISERHYKPITSKGPRRHLALRRAILDLVQARADRSRPLSLQTPLLCLN